MNGRDILATAVSNSFRSRVRTGLTVIAIFVGAFTLTMTTAIGTGVTDYIQTQVASLGASDVLTVTSTPDDSLANVSGPAPYDPEAATGGGFPGGGRFGPGLLDDRDVASIAATDGIKDVRPMEAVTPSYVEHDGSGRFQLQVMPDAQFAGADLAAGSQLADGDVLEILLPMSYVEPLGWGTAEAAVGQTVTIGTKDFQGEMHTVEAAVVGVQNQSLFGATAMIGQGLTDVLVEIQAIGRPDALQEGYLAVTATFDPEASEPELTAIKDELAEQGFTGQTTADQIGTIQVIIDGIIGVLNAFAVIALVASAFGIVNTLLMSVQERTREIGLMKAMGMSGRSVFALFSAEAVFIGFLGSALGAAVAIVVGSLISDALAASVLADLKGLNLLAFTPTSVGSIIVIIMAIAFLAGTLPARRASRQDPIDALRYE